ncbi:MAG: glycine cleavage system aminomethyltransferase GcvT [Pseudomonadota bacterium]
MTKQTVLYDSHVAAGAKMVDFAGWLMPVNYGSQIEEHHVVRRAAGMFDVSHMTILDVTGDGALAFLQYVVANNVGKLKPMQALYGALLNETGGVIDDLIVYRLDAGYRCVVNAGTRSKVIAWFDAQIERFDAQFSEQDEAMIAVQGPNAIAIVADVLGVDLDELSPFYAVRTGQMLIGRTGYTGENGVELMLPSAQAPGLWDDLVRAGVQPAGLGARDTLRLEAGLNLYGQDLDEEHTPLTSNIGWTISWKPAEREFVGRAALEAQRSQVPERLVGLVLQDKGVLRHGQEVVTSAGAGTVTSGSFSPTLQMSIGLARLPAGAEDEVTVDIRGKAKAALVVKPLFVRNGEVQIDL